MKKVLVIDNYDSFTYNLVHLLRSLGQEVIVWRNDKFTLEEASSFRKVVLSPGPGIPEEAGLLKPLLTHAPKDMSILGVCLGMQAIGEVYGGRLVNLEKVYHGVASEIQVISNDPLYEGLSNRFQVGRYHSWMVDTPLPDKLIATAVDSHGRPMSLRHSERPIFGVQYHPESILTPLGEKIIENWLKIDT